MPSTVEEDERVKRKIAEADRTANSVLGVEGASKDHKKKKKSASKSSDQDGRLKRKIAEADRIASSALLLSSECEIASATVEPAQQQSQPGVHLEPSARRVSKQRNVQVSADTSPGAYAIAGFNATSSSQALIIELELNDEPAMFEDDEVSQDNFTEPLATEDEPFDDEPVVPGSGTDRLLAHIRSSTNRTSRGRTGSGRRLSSGRISSGRLLAHFGSSQMSSSRSDARLLPGVREEEAKMEVGTIKSDNESEVLDAEVVVASVVNQSHTAFRQLQRRQIMCGLVFCLVIPIVVVLCVLLTRGNDDEPEDQTLLPLEPTGSPTSSLAPTFSTVPVTVVIWFDQKSGETGWELYCDGRFVDGVGAGVYYGKMGGDFVYETSMVPEGAECNFTMYDAYENGLCCEAGRGFYQLFLAQQQDVPKGFIREGSEFGYSESTEFIAILPP